MSSVLKGMADSLPNSIRNPVKRLYLFVTRTQARYRYVRLGKRAYLGRGFRMESDQGHCAYVGDLTNADDWNVWNTSSGPIRIGRQCWLGLYNIIMGPVVFGERVSTGPHVKILGPRHAVRGYDQPEVKETRIGDNVWISTDAIVMFGVSIGENSVIAPGSVVTKDVRANAFVAGNPARDLTNMVAFGDKIQTRGQ